LRAGARLSRWRGFGGEGERAWDENRFALLYVQLHLLLPHLGFASHGHILLPLQSAAAAAVSSSENLVDNPRKGKTLGQKIEEIPVGLENNVDPVAGVHCTWWWR
jgi:hypothetical protein